jgi:hypothetical protein
MSGAKSNLKTIKTMKGKLNQQLRIFWKGKICRYIEWETLNDDGKLIIQIDNNYITVHISELSN